MPSGVKGLMWKVSDLFSTRAAIVLIPASNVQAGKQALAELGPDA